MNQHQIIGADYNQSEQLNELNAKNNHNSTVFGQRYD